MFQKLASRDHSDTFSAVIWGVEFPDPQKCIFRPIVTAHCVRGAGAIRRRDVAAATCQRLAVGITGWRRCHLAGWAAAGDSLMVTPAQVWLCADPWLRAGH